MWQSGKRRVLPNNAEGRAATPQRSLGQAQLMATSVQGETSQPCGRK